MSTSSIQLTVDDGVAVLTIDNPGIRNALTIGMADDLAAACDEIDHRPEVGCVVVRGAGGTFCSGADTRTWETTYGGDPLSDRAYDETNRMYGSFVRLGRIAVPTISAVRGAAVGAGLNLALATDLRIVASDARILAGFLKAGIHPGGGFFTLVDRIAGRETAAALGLFSEEIDGTRARELGLAWLALPDDEVEPTALEFAARIAADPVLASRVALSFRLETSQRLSWEAALEAERGVQLWTQTRRLKRLAAREEGGAR